MCCVFDLTSSLNRKMTFILFEISHYTSINGRYYGQLYKMRQNYLIILDIRFSANVTKQALYICANHCD